MSYFVYILVSEIDRTLYTGQTSDLSARLTHHNRKKVKSTKNRAPYRIGYIEKFETRSAAMQREWELKTSYNTDRKKKLIKEFDAQILNEILR